MPAEELDVPVMAEQASPPADTAFELAITKLKEDQRAIQVDQCARICHEANRVLCVSFDDHSQAHWDAAPEWQKESTITGVWTVLGTPEGEIAPGVLHEAWADHKRADGWVFGVEKNADLKTHPCLVPFHHLPPHQQTKDDMFLAVVRAYFGL